MRLRYVRKKIRYRPYLSHASRRRHRKRWEAQTQTRMVDEWEEKLEQRLVLVPSIESVAPKLVPPTCSDLSVQQLVTPSLQHLERTFPFGQETMMGQSQLFLQTLSHVPTIVAKKVALSISAPVPPLVTVKQEPVRTPRGAIPTEVKIKTETYHDSNHPLPLLPHQREAIEFLQTLIQHGERVGMVEATMGCGKSRIAMELGQSFGWSILFITKAEVMQDIRDEALKWGIPNGSIVVCEPKHIPSYTTHCSSTHSNVPWMVVVDECHLLLKGPSTPLIAQSQAWNPMFTLLLSATPGDGPLLLRYFTQGQIKQTLSGNIYHYHWAESKVESKTMVLTFDAEQQKLYDDFRQEYSKLPEKGTKRFYCLTKMRETLSTWKLEPILNLIEEVMNKQQTCVVVSEFQGILDTLDLLLPTHIIRKRWDGSNQAQILKQFRSGQIPLLLANSKYVGHGINLGNTNALIFCEPHYIAEHQAQMTGRIRRVGCPSIPQVTWTILFANSCEDKLIAAHATLSPP